MQGKRDPPEPWAAPGWSGGAAERSGHMGDTTFARTIDGLEVPAEGTWDFDTAHSSLTIIARHMMFTKVRGTLSGLSGAIHVAEKPEDSWVEVEVDASSVDTRNETRDQHLRSQDFLHVENFPKITFR